MSRRTLRLRSGRRVGVSLLGDPAADRDVLLCHPAPGAAGFDPDPRVSAAQGIRLISVDRPGYGASEPIPTAEASVERFAGDLIEVLEQLRPERRVDVVGWGFGAVVAAALALDHPERVAGTAFVDPRGPEDPVTAQRARRGRVWIRGDLPLEPLSVLGIDASDPALGLPGLRGRLMRMLQESAAQGEAGVTADLHALRAARHRRGGWPLGAPGAAPEAPLGIATWWAAILETASRVGGGRGPSRMSAVGSTIGP